MREIFSAPQVLVCILLFFAVGCGRAVRDQQALDNALKLGADDIIVETGSPSAQEPKSLAAWEAQDFLASLNRTNRTKATSARGAVASWLTLRKGTNTILAVVQYDDGRYSVGDYYFSMKARR